MVEKSRKVRCNTADLQLHIITTGGNDLSWYANVTGKRPRYHHVHVCLRVVMTDPGSDFKSEVVAHLLDKVVWCGTSVFVCGQT